jgi:hypothetical protein
MQPIDKVERNAKIHTLRLEGLTLTAIGHEFGLNKSTVSEIARRMERRARWRASCAPAPWGLTRRWRLVSSKNRVLRDEFTRGGGSKQRLLNNPPHWHLRAQKAELLAAQLEDPVAKAATLRIAEEYELLAARAAKREADESDEPRKNDTKDSK